MAKRSGIVVKYYDGYIVSLDKTNVYYITPHRLVFGRNDYNLLVLYNDEYYGNADLFFIDG